MQLFRNQIEDIILSEKLTPDITVTKLVCISIYCSQNSLLQNMKSQLRVTHTQKKGGAINYFSKAMHKKLIFFLLQSILYIIKKRNQGMYIMPY